MAGIRYSLNYAKIRADTAPFGIAKHLSQNFSLCGLITRIEPATVLVPGKLASHTRGFTSSLHQRKNSFEDAFPTLKSRSAKLGNTWIRDSIKVLCRSYRMIPAEELAAATGFTPEDIMLEFFRSYVSLRQPEKLQVWLERLFDQGINSKRANELLWILLSAKLWRETQALIKMMNKSGLQINTNLLAECIASMPQKPDPVAIAALLGEDGRLITSSKFRRSMGADVRTRVAHLLDNEQIDEAIESIMSYKGVHQVSLCLQLLWHELHNHQRRVSPQTLNTIFIEKIDPFPIKDNKYVQAKLCHYLITEDFKGAMEFADSIDIYSMSPKISGKLDYQSYQLMWRLLLAMSGHASGAATNTTNILSSSHLRAFVVSTTANAALRPNLLATMLCLLNTLPDIPAMVTLLQYATEVCGVSIQSQRIASIVSAPAVIDSEVVDHTNWKSVANAICEYRNVDLANILDQSRGFRNQLCI